MRIERILPATLLAALLVACGQKDNAPAVASNTPAQRACSNGGSMMLSDSGIGAVRLGVSPELLQRECFVVKDTTVQLEGMPQRVLRVRMGPSELHAEISPTGVSRIGIIDSLLRAPDGLGVGTTLEEMLASPGVTGMRGEGAVYLRVPAHCGMSFQLDSAASRALRGGATITRAQLQAISPASQIVRVLVFGCNAPV